MIGNPDVLERAISELRRPVELSPDLDARVMARVRDESQGRHWLLRPRLIRLSPVAMTAIAAGLVAVAFGLGTMMGPAGENLTAPATVPAVVATIRFEFAAPGAERVVVVGDFNNWNSAGTPLREIPGTGRWTVDVPLAPGRYHYTYVVDGQTWVADPHAPAALDDFGTPTSVITVSRSS